MSKQIEVTTECPTCHQAWTRWVYEMMPWGVITLTMCDECVKNNSDENGNLTISLVKKYPSVC